MDIFREELNELKRKNLFRKFRTINSSCSGVVKLDGRNYIMLASNNYFGLNAHPKVITAAKSAIDKYGAGNGASRLVINLDLHEKLEKEIAKYKKCQSALVYSSGYAANTGIISSIVGKGDAILSDELNHASIIDGCRLSKAEIAVYKHCDINDLKSKLPKIRRNSKKRKVLVVTDSVFSMHGDIAPLRDIIELKKKYSFLLMADDAHATGIIDTNFKEIDLHMGTLSKALGSQGGFVAGSKGVIDYLRNKSRSFIYSTGLSPPDAAGALAALKIISKDKRLRKRLLENAQYLRSGLKDAGFNAGGNLQIIPVFVGGNKKVMQFQKLLENDGIFVTGIRPPTVPEALLRVSVTSEHSRGQLDMASKSFEKTGKKLDIIF